MLFVVVVDFEKQHLCAIQTLRRRSTGFQVGPFVSNHIVLVRSLAEAQNAVISTDNNHFISYKSGSVTSYFGAFTSQLEKYRKPQNDYVKSNQA